VTSSRRLTGLDRLPKMVSCFSCTTEYKVSEFQGHMVCQGFCRRKLENQLSKGSDSAAAGKGGESPVTRAAGDAAAAVASPPAVAAKRSPSWNVGDYCRAPCKDAPGESLEAVVSAISPCATKVKVTFMGRGEDKYKVYMKDLVPSRGKDARERQSNSSLPAAAASDWKVGDKCRAVFSEDGVEYNAEIQSVSGANAVVLYTDYGNQEEKPLKDIKPMPAKPKVGDAVRATYSEDSIEYEAVIASIGESEGYEYAIVTFVGFLNQETVWLSELKKSKGPLAVMEQEKAAKGDDPGGAAAEMSRAESSSFEVTPEVPEPAVAPAPAEVPVPEKSEPERAPAESSEPASQPARLWKVGDFCRTVYSEDSQEYEGKIIAVGEDGGYKYYTVQFLGYGNEESVWEDAMMESKGPDERKAQLAICGIEEEEVAKEEEVPAPEDHSHKSTSEAEAKAATPTPAAAVEPLPAQEVAVEPDTTAVSPQKEWKVGQRCRAVFSEDGVEYEGEIADIRTEECGNKSATVVFVGYGNEEYCWVEQLLESNPAERKAVLEMFGIAPDEPEPSDQNNNSFSESKQAEEAVTKEVEVVKPAITREVEAVKPAVTKEVETVKPAVESIPSLPSAPAVKAPPVVVAPPGGTTVQNPADLSSEASSALPSLTRGDFCRVVYKGPEVPSCRGQELEGLVFSIDGEDTTVRILGTHQGHNIYQKVKTGSDALKPSGGSASREEQVMRFRNMEKTTPSETVANDKAIQHDPSTPSISPLASQIRDVNQGLPILQDLCNQLFNELDMKGCNRDLMKRIEGLEANVQLLKEQNEVIRAGNLDLLKQLKKNSKAIANGGLDENGYRSTIEVAVKNIEAIKIAEKKRYDDLQARYTNRLEIATQDEKALMGKIDEVKQENQRLRKEVLSVKREKQELINETITLKARLIQ